MQRKVVFLDRDGTIIEDKIYLNDPEQIVYLPNAMSGLKQMQNMGYEFVVVTNQSGVARGLVELPNLWEIHRRIRAACALNGIDILDFYYAPFMTDTDHWMRKPNPGMLTEAAREFRVDLGQSWMVGDRMSDVEAGRRAGAKTVLLSPSQIEGPLEFDPPTFVCRDLLGVAECIHSTSIK